MQQPPSGETWALVLYAAMISMQSQHLYISSFIGILVWDEEFYSGSGSFLHNVIDALNKGYVEQLDIVVYGVSEFSVETLSAYSTIRDDAKDIGYSASSNGDSENIFEEERSVRRSP
ncbi:hypothetical protein HZH66_011727 [Vespula vulgaris]|uniref:Uncharacterized protein n=1 Tax=Vespula vulgaris TaxID=7454 RepID=A0A834JD92_VESVU|nr:hypothetical protein HZH66_011727 [Vespula vulgaris]